MSDPRAIPNPRTFRERVGALRTLRPFLAMVWAINPRMTAGSLALRLVRALIPIAGLYVGKLIIDDVVHLVQMPDRPASLQAWLDSGHLAWLGTLLLAEFGLAVVGDVLLRLVGRSKTCSPSR